MQDSFDALIFDCDGVLVNSEQIAQEIQLACLSSIGLDYARDEYVRRFSGTSASEFRDAIRQDFTKHLETELPTSFLDEMFSAIVLAYEERLEPIAGASELAIAWPKSKAVASSSTKDLLRLKLRKANLDGVFREHVYSADAVKKGKPDPAVFIYAANQLGVDPARCIVIEDSVNGIVAAKRAGMTAIGFVGGGHCLDDQTQLLYNSRADSVFETHAELSLYLGLVS